MINIVLLKDNNDEWNDDNEDYDLSKWSPISKHELKIGSKKIPRYNCGNHKLNLSFRRAIRRFKLLVNILKSSNKATSHIKKTIKLSKVIANKNVDYD